MSQKKLRSKKKDKREVTERGFPSIFLEESSGVISDYVVDYKFVAKSKLSITQAMVNTMWEKAIAVNKKPFLIVSIPRDKNNFFILKCSINLEKKEH